MPPALLLCLAIGALDDGEPIYRRQCLRCHGPAGEGTPESPRALTGDRSVAQLSKLIAETMPEDDPGTCTGPDADRVAAYIHDAFYSKAARERNKPPRVELSRLTVVQHRNAVADLVGSFREPGGRGEARGLKGEYFDGPRPRNDRRKLDRVDPEVRFDFLTAAPAEGIDARAFSARWTGSFYAADSGEYEFLVRTDHGARLHVNRPGIRPATIDAWVKSGPETEHRGAVELLGGRHYSIALEFGKGKQGVADDEKKRAQRPPAPASVALLWKTPRGVVEPMPTRVLSPEGAPERFVPFTPFPPDDRSVGYERGTSVSAAWDQAATDAAIEVADEVEAHLNELAGTKADDPDRAQKLRGFAQTFAERAFRRPLSAEQVHSYIGVPFERGPDPDTAVKRVVLMAMKSPRFLYREVGGPDQYDVASRLSFALWDAPPDKELREAATSGQLATREHLEAQAARMLPDPRTKAKLRAFFHRWLRVEQAADLQKDAAKYPGFDASLVADLRTSLDLFLDDVVWGETSDFRRLLTADQIPLNGRLAAYYGADLPADAPFGPVALDPGQRAGVVSHPYLLSSFAYTATSSPIHRGVFLARGVLGRSLKPPPEAVAPLAPDLHAGLSTRERVALQTSPPACMTCHGLINPLGFGLERFDAVGRLRAAENDRPVDASGSYETRSGDTARFDGARALADFLANSEEAQSAFVEQLFHHAAKQPVRAYGSRKLADLRRSFEADAFHIRRLWSRIAVESSLATPAPPS